MLTRFLCRLLLLAFPARFRHQRGRALVQTLVDDSRDASGRLSPARFAAGALDVIRAGLSERITPAPSTLETPPASTSSSTAWRVSRSTCLPCAGAARISAGC